MKENLVGKINEILGTFTKQELGNKITQFNMTGLAHVLITELLKEEDDAPVHAKSTHVPEGDAKSGS